MIDINKIIGNNIKRLRKAKKLTQSQLADKLYLEKNAFISIEKGSRLLNLSRLNILCNILECNLIDIFLSIEQKQEIYNQGYNDALNEINSLIIEKQTKFVNGIENNLKVIKESFLNISNERLKEISEKIYISNIEQTKVFNCGNCKYNRIGELIGEIICNNKESKEFNNYKSKNDCCSFHIIRTER